MASDELFEVQQGIQEALPIESEALADGQLEIPSLEDLKTQHSPEDIAAAFFQMNEKKLVRLVNHLGLKQLQRVFMHVALGNLGVRPYKLIGDNGEPEKQAAYVFNDLVTQRYTMQLALEMEKAEKAHEKELEVSKQTDALNKGEADGTNTEKV